MISNNQHMSDFQPSKGKSYPGRIVRLPLKETKQQQAREPQCGSKPEPMDVSSERESSRPFLLPRSTQPGSVQKLCYKLDLDWENDSDIPELERPPPIDYSNRRDPDNMALQTAQIFRGVEISKDGTVLAENERATRSNAGKKPRKGKRSRQAANIHRALDEEAFLEENDKESGSAKVLSLVVIGEYDALEDLVRYAPRKLQKREATPPTEERIPLYFHPIRELPPIV